MVKQPKVHSLTGRIDMARMHRAFIAVKRNRGAAGVDGVSIDMFEANLEQNLFSLMTQLKCRGQYIPLPLQRAYVPKGNGKLRPLGIPTVRDRVAQEVIRSLIEPIFEPTFSDFSFGFRPGRNQHQAIEAIIQFKDDGFKFVVDADISGCFDNINHELVIDLIAQRVADGNILNIVRQFLTADVLDNGKIVPVDSGTPQGGVISPLLANIVLHQLDVHLTQADLKFVRFADDFVILCQSNSLAEQALFSVSDFLQNQLYLQLSSDKTSITSFHNGFDFLGFHITSRHITIRQKSLEKLKQNIRMNTIRSRNLDHRAVFKLNRILNGFANYFDTHFSNVSSQLTKLDCWVRKRIRCMKFKRISKSDNFRLKNKHLRNLGLMSLAKPVIQS